MTATMSLDAPDTVPTRFWHALPDERIQCDVCPRACKLREGQRGVCFVRGRIDDQIVFTSYGRSTGLCVDPIEKKPLFHFLPGTAVLSFGTAGCNLGCRFCQNWNISKSKDVDRASQWAAPDEIAEAALRLECDSVAFTYNDPVVFLEYAVDTAMECRQEGIRTVGVTAGYVLATPRATLFAQLDAVNIDLKAFSDDFYRHVAMGRLEPVLETIEYVHHETPTWLELTTLVIPGYNDSDHELGELSEWVAGHLGPDVPIHFTAFHPAFRMLDVPPTPAVTLRRAAAIARANGLRYVYTGNVVDREWQRTRCPECRAALIERSWHAVETYRLDEDGTCPACRTTIPGVFARSAGTWGSRRVAVSLPGTGR